MPKRTDIHSILILGAGPIVIGQGCEFDYSGVQACKALKEEGYRIILINSNPATVMTDPDLAHVVYIEPLLPEVITRIIQQEKPDALLPTMGGQTALNCALALAQNGVLDRYSVQLIGASQAAIEKAEDRALFRTAMQKIGLEVARSVPVYSMTEALEAQANFGFPVVVRPSYTLGGSGGGIAYHLDEFQHICERGFALSSNHELLIEESIIGWKEFELEVVRDKNDNCIVVCSIENIDPVGIHTGDSITVSPAQTLTDKEYQSMRNAAFAVLREVGVETGGANVQFAIEPDTGRLLVIEMNPRVSRSSALASKATGFPIAKAAAKLAVGYTLDEVRHDMTSSSIPLSFEPTLDYIVVKLPRFHFEKFPEADTILTTQMKSVGEVMALGENFQQALQKAILSLETGYAGLASKLDLAHSDVTDRVWMALHKPNAERLFYIADAFRLGWSIETIHEITLIDRWFLRQIAELVTLENELTGLQLNDIDAVTWKKLKKKGFSDQRLAQLLNESEENVRAQRLLHAIKPVYQRVDSCAAEFAVSTAYMYSTYQEACESAIESQPKIAIIGSGANRIGQGIEFDYCCVHAVFAVKEAGYQAIMINCNPETVSTDYDTTDRLYFEPLSAEHVLSILALEKPDGVIIQLGGQTSLKLAKIIEQAGFNIIGTSSKSIELAEDRAQFSALVHRLGLDQPKCIAITALAEGIKEANKLAYSLLVRPSFVLGGRAMKVVHNSQALEHYLIDAFHSGVDVPILVDQFLENAIEVDVDAICDGESVLITAIMEHIEPAGVHSGDSACSLPPFSLSDKFLKILSEHVKQLAFALNVKGLMNVQFAIQHDCVYVLEVNPRASRTMPFVAKATGVPIIKLATQIMLGKKLKALVAEQANQIEKLDEMLFKLKSREFAIKYPVFPFAKFPGVDPLLGPEMKSTGEVMGQGEHVGEALKQAMLAAGLPVPENGKIILSVRDEDKKEVIILAKKLIEKGFQLIATSGTAVVLQAEHIACERVDKIDEGRPNIIDLIKNKTVTWIIHTANLSENAMDSAPIRIAALQHRICHTSTLREALAIAGLFD